MKKLLLLFAVLVCITFYNSCTKDKAQQPVSVVCSGVDSAANTYNLKIKPILDGNCGYGGCHNTITASSNVILDNYADSKTAFLSKRALCTIKQEGGCLPMPQGYDKLADSLITYIQCWSERGYPQ